MLKHVQLAPKIAYSPTGLLTVIGFNLVTRPFTAVVLLAYQVAGAVGIYKLSLMPDTLVTSIFGVIIYPFVVAVLHLWISMDMKDAREMMLERKRKRDEAERKEK